MHEAALFQVPMPLHFGLSFSWALFIPMLVIYLVTALEAIGDVTATSKVSRQPVEGPLWMQRIKGGVLVNGANSLLAGVFNTFPSSIFAQNNGVIQLTGIASRHIGVWIAIMLVLLGLFPSVAGVIQAVPEPVLGGAAMVMFGAVAASGINILASTRLDRRALLIISVSLALGWVWPRCRSSWRTCRRPCAMCWSRGWHRWHLCPGTELVPAGEQGTRLTGTWPTDKARACLRGLFALSWPHYFARVVHEIRYRGVFTSPCALFAPCSALCRGRAGRRA